MSNPRIHGNMVMAKHTTETPGIKTVTTNPKDLWDNNYIGPKDRNIDVQDLNNLMGIPEGYMEDVTNKALARELPLGEVAQEYVRKKKWKAFLEEKIAGWKKKAGKDKETQKAVNLGAGVAAAVTSEVPVVSATVVGVGGLSNWFLQARTTRAFAKIEHAEEFLEHVTVLVKKLEALLKELDEDGDYTCLYGKVSR